MARLIFLLMIVFLAGHGVCAGAETSPVSLRAEAPTESHEIGRLFFSPDERAMLDRVRNKRGGNTASPTEQITLNGIVRRSSGKTTTWINQVPQHENEAPQGVSIQPGQASKPTTVLLLPSGKQVQLKAGQTFDTTKGKVREGYQDATALPSPEAAK